MSSSASEPKAVSFCAGCGTSLEPGARFCPKCGAAVNTANAHANAQLPFAATSATLPTDEIAELERIAGEHPVDADQHRQGKHDRTIQVDNTHGPHHEMVSRRTGNADEGMTDIIPGRAQRDDRKKISQCVRRTGSSQI